MKSSSAMSSRVQTWRELAPTLIASQATVSVGVRRALSAVQSALPAYAFGAATLTVIWESMPGSRQGAANPLFREARTRFLRRKT